MISYAQNFEDVILARVFKGQAQGFYIDVGVWQPTEHSVTKHFYDLGWSGVNVEALPSNYELIRAARPRDINVNAAASTKPGPLRFHEVISTGLSTSRDDYAAMHKTAGFPVRDVEVQTVSLKSVCDQHAHGKVIDFLKIDVEGAEADVVASADWHAYRPRVVVIEATVPLSSEVSYADWEPSLLACGYTFCYFDGLNRWYLRDEDLHLKPALGVPANPADNFRLATVVELERELASARAELQRMRDTFGSARGLLRAVAKKSYRALPAALRWRLNSLAGRVSAFKARRAEYRLEQGLSPREREIVQDLRSPSRRP